MKLMLNSSVLIDCLRDNPLALAMLAQSVAAGDDLWSVAVVRTEIVAGVRSGEEQKTDLLLRSLQWHPVTTEIADRAGELTRRFRASHHNIDIVDYLVAAAAEALEAPLLTRNVRHFPMFAGLRPPY